MAEPAASPTAASTARALSIACWAVIAAVVLRIASGGGSLTGLGYVLRTEPALDVAAGAVVLVAAVIVVIGLIGRHAWAWGASRLGAAVALAASVLLLLGGHDSAVLSGLAAVVAWVVAVRADGRGTDPLP